MNSDMPKGQAQAHTHVSRGDERMENMEKPRKVEYMNDGQTKVTLIGRWFFMTPEEIKAEYLAGVQREDPFYTRIHDAIADVLLKKSPHIGEGKGNGAGPIYNG